MTEDKKEKPLLVLHWLFVYFDVRLSSSVKWKEEKK